MNNKEFIAELSHRFGYTQRDVTTLLNSITGVMSKEWQEGNIVSIQNFGIFEVKKKLERISVNPLTKQRMLIPPKLVLSYKPSTALKEKYK